MRQDNFVYDIWYFAGLARDVRRGKLHAIEIAGQPIALGRDDKGDLFALRDICPHRAAPLSAGKMVGGNVECPYHGWQFSARSGQCQHIPAICAGQSDPSAGINVRTYPVRQTGQLLWVYIASDAKAAPAPAFAPPSIALCDRRPLIVRKTTLNCHIDHAVIGLMDPAHGPFVHQQWWWRSQKSMHEKAKDFAPIARGFAMTAHKPSSNSLAYKLLGGAPVTEISFQLPNIRLEHIRVGKKAVMSFTAVTPVSAAKTEIMQIFFSDHPVFRALSPFLGGFAEKFLLQDAHMVDLQARGLAYDPKLMLIADADTQALWYYALKKEWAKSHQEGRDFVNPVKAKTLRWRS